LKVKQPPVGVKLIAMLYFVGAAGYIVLLLAWLFARAPLISFIEEATPSATLGPTLLLDVPGVVTAYFVVLAALCCWESHCRNFKGGRGSSAMASRFSLSSLT
jgi:hypothetical protein